MSENIIIHLDEELSRTIRRLAAQASTTPDRVVALGIFHINRIASLGVGERLVFEKTLPPGALTVESVLDGRSLDGDGFGTSEDG